MNSLFYQILKALFGGIFLLSIYSCQLGETEAPNFDAGGAYYPLVLGNYITYDIQRITFDELIEDDTLNYQMRALFADTLTDLEGDQSFRIEQYIRLDSEEEWVIDSVWTVKVDQARIIQYENNVPFIKLVLPEEEGRVWDGNILNTWEEDEYVIENFEEGFEANTALFFANTLTVNQSSDSSLVNRDVRWEVYADSVGLIYKKIENYQYIDDNTDPFFGTDSIIGGVFWEQKVIDFGKE